MNRDFPAFDGKRLPALRGEMHRRLSQIRFFPLPQGRFSATISPAHAKGDVLKKPSATDFDLKISSPKHTPRRKYIIA